MVPEHCGTAWEKYHVPSDRYFLTRYPEKDQAVPCAGRSSCQKVCETFPLDVFIDYYPEAIERLCIKFCSKDKIDTGYWLLDAGKYESEDRYPVALCL